MIRKSAYILLVLIIGLFCFRDFAVAENLSDLPAWEKQLRETNAKKRENLLQQLNTLQTKEIGFLDTYVRNCTPATLTTLGTAKVLGMEDGMCLYNKTVGTKASMECKIPQEELGNFVDEAIILIKSGQENPVYDKMAESYCIR